MDEDKAEVFRINMFQDELCISLKTANPEIEANYFAAELLIADDDILDLLDKIIPIDRLALLLVCIQSLP